MANTSITVKDASGTTRSVDAWSAPNGDLREGIVICDPDAETVARILSGQGTGTEAGLAVHLVSRPRPRTVTASRGSYGPSTASQVILADNPNRQFATIYNNTNNTAYLTYAATSSPTTADVPMPPESIYEMPTNGEFRYTGVLSVVWATASTGGFRVVDFSG